MKPYAPQAPDNRRHCKPHTTRRPAGAARIISEWAGRLRAGISNRPVKESAGTGRLTTALWSAALLCVLLPAGASAQDNDGCYHDERYYARARIEKIETEELAAKNSQSLTRTKIHLHILDGEFKGQQRTAIFQGENDMPANIKYRTGDTVFAGISKVGYAADSVEYVSLYDVDNTLGLIILAGLLVAVIAGIGRIKGLFSLLALLLTIVLLFAVFIPLVLKGWPPLPIALLICVLSTIITMPIIAGWQRKALAAIAGASAGIICAALLAIAFGRIMHLSGIVTSEMITVFYAAESNIDLRDLALSGMMLAALGAIMDVAVSISSSTAEIFEANPEISFNRALKSVLTIGKDILGSMVNTLVLAYVGSSLPLIMLISMRIEPGMPWQMVFSYNPVLSEIVKSAVGSIAMFLVIPFTAVVAVWLYRRKHASHA